MQIPFRKVLSSDKEFKYESDGVVLEGSLSKINKNLIRIEATFKGKALMQCSRCGIEFEKEIDLESNLVLSDGQYTSDSRSLDEEIIEVEDGLVDIDSIHKSEMGVLMSDYHYCPSCDSDELFEIEY